MRHASVVAEEGALNGLRLGMSLDEVKSEFGPVELLATTNFFGEWRTEYGLEMTTVIVDREDRIVGLMGFPVEFERNGIDLKEIPSSESQRHIGAPDRSEWMPDCISLVGTPANYFGHVPIVSLGELSVRTQLEYRADSRGGCLDNLRQVVWGIAREVETQESELRVYPGNLECSEGGPFQFSRDTVVCNIHRQGARIEGETLTLFKLN